MVVREVVFRNSGVTLSGTAYIPSRGNHLPGVVALHGASEPLRSSRVYEHLREGLPRIGFAVLLFDRRGEGRSSGSRSADYETLADDAVAGQEALGTIPRLDPDRIGFWGISQGGWVAILAARRSRRPTFAMPVSAPLGTTEYQMEFATSNMLKIHGYGDHDVKEMLHARRTWLDFMKGNLSLSLTSDVIRRAQRRPWYRLAFMPKARELEGSRGALKELNFDASRAVEGVSAPLFFIYGGADPWIPVMESIAHLRALAGKMPNITYSVIPRANHVMMLNEQERMDFDSKTLNAQGPDAPSYFMMLGSWLSLQARGRRNQQPIH